jgi:hypothetical protein
VRCEKVSLSFENNIAERMSELRLRRFLPDVHSPHAAELFDTDLYNSSASYTYAYHRSNS